MPTKPKKISPLKKIVHAFHKTDPGLGWEQVSKTIVAATVLLAIVIVSPWGTEAWQLPKMWVILSGAALGWITFAIACIRRRTFLWSWQPLDVLVLLFVGSVAIGSLTSVNWWASIFGVSSWRDQSLLHLLGYVGLYFFIAKTFLQSADRKILWWAMFLGLGFSFLLHFFQFNSWSILPEPWNSQVWFNILDGSPRQLSILAAVFATASMLLALTMKERWSRWLAGLGVALPWLFLFLSSQVLGWTMFALGMVLVVLHSARQKTLHPGWMITAVVLAGIGMIAQVTNVMQSSSLPRPVELSLDQRSTIQISLTTLWHRPVLGSGPTTWYEDFITYRDTNYNSTPAWNIRFVQGGSAWWQALATLGVVGSLLFLGTVVLGWWTGWRAWQKTGDVSFLLGVLGGGAVFLTGWFAPWSQVLLLMMWVGFGLTRAAVLESAKTKRQPLAPRHIAGFAVLILIMVVVKIPFLKLTASDFATQHAQALFNKLSAGQTTENTKVLEQANTWLGRAVSWDGQNATAAILLANTKALRIQNNIQREKLTEAQADLDAMNEVLQAAKLRLPHEPTIYEAENNLLNLLNGIIPNTVQKAQQNFGTLRRLEPASPIHDVGYGQTLLAERSSLTSNTSTVDRTKAEQLLTKALSVYKEALTKKADYFQAKYAYAQALVTASRFAEAIAELPDAVSSSGQAGLVQQVQAQALAGLKQDDEAIAAFQASIASNKEDPYTYLLFSEYYRTKKDTTKAKAVLTDGLKALPGNAQLLSAQEAL